MRKLMVGGLVAILVLGGIRAQEEENDAAAVAVRVKDLSSQIVAKDAAPPVRVAALHAWVRDQVKQIRTSFG